MKIFSHSIDLHHNNNRLAEESCLDKLGCICFHSGLYDLFHSLLFWFLHLYSNSKDIPKRIQTSYSSMLSSSLSSTTNTSQCSNKHSQLIIKHLLNFLFQYIVLFVLRFNRCCLEYMSIAFNVPILG